MEKTLNNYPPVEEATGKELNEPSMDKVDGKTQDIHVTEAMMINELHAQVELRKLAHDEAMRKLDRELTLEIEKIKAETQIEIAKIKFAKTTNA